MCLILKKKEKKEEEEEEENSLSGYTWRSMDKTDGPVMLRTAATQSKHREKQPPDTPAK